MNAYDKVIGYDEIKAELNRISDVIRNPDKYRKLGVSIPHGVLLFGEPGLGKTLLANCFIEDTGRKKYVIRKDKPNGEFIDHITKTFKKAAEHQPSVIFFDDIDKYSEGSMRDYDAEEYVAIQSGIDMIKENNHDIFCIGTCNDIDNLPRSLIRAGRFDNRIEVNAPRDLSVASSIIEHYLKDKNVSDDINPYDIARLMEGKSCAELETVVNEAGIYAGYAGREQIGEDDMIKACLRVIFDAPESVTGTADTTDARMVATHEAGHVVVAEVLRPGIVNVASISRHAGDTGGVTCVTKPELYDYSYEMHEETIMRHLAGRAAVEVVYGIPDVGSEYDMKKAYDSIEHFVTELHLYGFDTHTIYDDSDYWNSSKNYRITYELERYYKQAKKILIENRAFLDDVIEALLSKQTLTFKDIAQIRDQLRLHLEIGSSENGLRETA